MSRALPDTNGPPSLDELAREIDTAHSHYIQLEGEYRDRQDALNKEFEDRNKKLFHDALNSLLPRRRELGQLLNTVRAQFTKAADFDQWVRENTKVSRTVAYEYMKLAKAEDPEAADADRRAGQAKRKRELRSSFGTSTVPDGSATQEPRREPVTLPEGMVRDAPLRVTPSELADRQPRELGIADDNPAPVQMEVAQAAVRALSPEDFQTFGKWFDELREQSQDAEARQAYVEEMVYDWFSGSEVEAGYKFGEWFDTLREQASESLVEENAPHKPFDDNGHFREIERLRKRLRKAMHPDKYEGVSDSEYSLLLKQYQEMDAILREWLPQRTLDNIGAGDPSAPTP